MSELAYVLYCIITKIITKGNVYLICSIDKLLDSLVGSYTETASITGKRIEFFPGCAGVHTLELFVHCLYLFFGLTGIFHHIGHRLVHRSKVRHALANGHRYACKRCYGSYCNALNLVEPICSAIEPRLLCVTLITHSLQFLPQLLHSASHLTELCSASVHTSQLLVEYLDGGFEVAHTCPVEVLQCTIDKTKFTLCDLDVCSHLVNLLVILVDETVDLLLVSLNLLELSVNLIELRYRNGVLGGVRLHIGNTFLEICLRLFELVVRGRLCVAHNLAKVISLAHEFLSLGGSFCTNLLPRLQSLFNFLKLDRETFIFLRVTLVGQCLG